MEVKMPSDDTMERLARIEDRVRYGRDRLPEAFETDLLAMCEDIKRRSVMKYCPRCGTRTRTFNLAEIAWAYIAVAAVILGMIYMFASSIQ